MKEECYRDIAFLRPHIAVSYTHLDVYKRQLGELYYKKIKSGKETDESAAAIVNAINEKIGKINILKNEINSIKHKRICPECGAAVDDTSNYCNSCGAKLTYENAESTDE